MRAGAAAAAARSVGMLAVPIDRYSPHLHDRHGHLLYVYRLHGPGGYAATRQGVGQALLPPAAGYQTADLRKGCVFVV